jgi:hypothetical protein
VSVSLCISSLSLIFSYRSNLQPLTSNFRLLRSLTSHSVRWRYSQQ